MFIDNSDVNKGASGAETKLPRQGTVEGDIKNTPLLMQESKENMYKAIITMTHQNLKGKMGKLRSMKHKKHGKKVRNYLMGLGFGIQENLLDQKVRQV